MLVLDYIKTLKNNWSLSMSLTLNENISSGINLQDLMMQCAVDFDMTPSSTLAVADSLFEIAAISYPRTEGRHMRGALHADGLEMLTKLATLSPDWATLVERTDAEYQSSVWVNESEAFLNTQAIRPIATVGFDDLDQDQKNVFSVIAERYIALFDPLRSTAGSAVTTPTSQEYRIFKTCRHSKQVEVFGETVDLLGPAFFVDNRDGSIFLAVVDGTSGEAWLQVPFPAISEFMNSMPFASIADFAAQNLDFLSRFVREANNTVLPEGGGLYVCADNTYEVRNGLRHYLWPCKR
jgi:hypothetical protein